MTMDAAPDFASLTDQELTEECYRALADLNDLFAAFAARSHLHVDAAMFTRPNTQRHLTVSIYTKVPVRKELL